METPSHPLVRLALPSLVLYLFYWMLLVHPAREPGAASAKMSAEESRRLVERSTNLLRANRYKDALDVVLRLHQADPNNHVYLSDLAAIYGNLNRFDEEARYWEMFFERAPLPIEACPQIGAAYQKQSKMKEAVNAFERCLALEPGNSDSLFYLAHALERQGDYARAASLYKRGLASSPDYADLRIGLARTELRQGRPDEARKMSVQVLQRSADNVDALLVAGLASWRTGDRAAARSYLEKGAKLSHNDSDFQTALARLNQEDRR
jgi:tetratricopeptide (TPR) repeat protein